MLGVQELSNKEREYGCTPNISAPETAFSDVLIHPLTSQPLKRLQTPISSRMDLDSSGTAWILAAETPVGLPTITYPAMARASWIDVNWLSVGEKGLPWPLSQISWNSFASPRNTAHTRLFPVSASDQASGRLTHF